MKIKSKLIASCMIFSSTFLLTPQLSVAKESSSSNFLTKIFSLKPSNSKKIMIFKTDIDSLNIQNLDDFEFSIQDILRNYFDKKTVNQFLNNISNKDDNNLDANNLDQLDNLLPKTETDKINGPALLRIAQKLGIDATTTFEIKKNIVLKIVASQGITLAYSEKPKPTEVVKAIKEDDVKIDKGTSSSTGWIAGLVGVGLAGGGGGGGGSSSGISDGTYRNTISGDYASEYTAQAGLASVNSLSLNDYGYTGAGIKVAVVDSGIDKTHAEFDGKTIYGQDFSSSASGYGYDEHGHGSHVASIIAGDRDASGMRGVAYDATLYDYKWLDSSGNVSYTDTSLANMINQHVTDNISISNNSWGGSTRVNGVTNSYVTSTYSQSIAALKSAQSNGTLFVFAAGNNGLGSVALGGASQPNLLSGIPYHDSDLAGAWLVVVAVDPTLTETKYTDRCGLTYDFCVTAPGGGDNQNTDGIYAAQTNGTYVRYSGTSMAAPHVSGLAAALMEKFPSLTATQISTRIKTTASYDGLTGYSGQTSANSSTATLQAIFGHGLINSTAAAASLGNYIYANGSNLSNGTNLSVSKISLPSGLPASTQNQILASKFIVFDSFDGARFSVNGSEVFKISNSSIVRTYGNVKKIDTHTDPKFGYTSTGEKVNHSKWSPRYITTGNSNEMSTADGFWGNTASLFSSSSMLQGQTLTNFIWSDSIGDIVVQPFFQIQDEQDSSQSIGGYGASFHLNVNEGLKAVAGYKMSNHLFNNGIMSDSASIGSTKDFELGFVQNISTNDNMFVRFSNSQIENLTASDKTFGFKDAKSDSWTIGYETNNKLGSFAFGVSKPNQLSSGTVSLVTPTGRSRSGDVFYAETEFAVSSENRLDKFFAYQHEKDNLALSFGVVEDRYNYGNIGAAKLDISYHF
ncbi:S8 family serine peptidase [Alphaproteobacteria bacterium]|nr:S8 family serine peptidase [Alphaproteobacteria bacterium]